MPTRTTPRTSAKRTSPRTASTGGRFARSTTTSPSRRAMRRRPAPRSKSSKALNGLAGMLPGSVLGKKAKPSASGGGKGRKAGFALLAGAAGLAVKNRDKLPGPLGRKTEEPYDVPTQPVTPPPGAAEPVAITPDPVASSSNERPNG